MPLREIQVNFLVLSGAWSVGALSAVKKSFFVSAGKVLQGQCISVERGWSL